MHLRESEPSMHADENLCRQQLSEEELDNLIKAKKSILTGKGVHSGESIFTRVKHIFGRK